MKYEYLSNQVAQVRKAPKRLPYTITPIMNIERYRVEQKDKEEQYQLLKEDRYLKHRAIAVTMVEEQLSVLKFNKAEKEEATVLARRMQLKVLNSLMKQYGNDKDHYTVPKLTRLQRVKLFCIQQLKSLLVKLM